MAPIASTRIKEICQAIASLVDHNFAQEHLIVEALSHPSLTQERGNDRLRHYERLEFLGDAVLGLVITELLIGTFPEESEGDLAKRRSALVCHQALSVIANELQLGSFLLMSEGERATGGASNPRNLENCLEAIIGALYLDGGLEIARHFIYKHWRPLLGTMTLPPKDPKSKLQEWAQETLKENPAYTLIEQRGPSHLPTFYVQVQVRGLPSVIGEGMSKREAEKKAAALLLEYIAQHQTK